MLKPARLTLIGAVALGGATAAQAADIYEPPIVEAPPQVVYERVDTGGWYIRGDVDYHWSNLRGADYITYGVDCCGNAVPGTNALNGDLGGSWSLGAGVGYQVNHYLRTDLTADYWFDADFEGSTVGTCGLPPTPCTSVDESSFSALLLLANAYAELGTYHGFKPYVGAGIGGAHVDWDDLRNTVGGVTQVHAGASEWRFAWALMAGTSYCLTDSLLADVGYRYSRISGGRMFEESGIGVGPGFDDGIDTHEVRAGLRWQFGGNDSCAPQQIAYEPEPMPVYK